jgi:dTDP-4-amino-4,6-dideoxygalactose transaminase
MPELVVAHGNDLSAAFPHARRLLERAVSLPVMVKMAEELPQIIRKALSEALSGSTPELLRKRGA